MLLDHLTVPVSCPVFKNWNGGIQKRKISWCVELYPLSTQAKNTKVRRKCRVGWVKPQLACSVI
ncbi:MAG: hypothetical protein KAW12_20865 [Candidatus Aminicenantes bacterium]|nr:hypothetical protein [Candidatus Aminicenantes bacterium]